VCHVSNPTLRDSATEEAEEEVASTEDVPGGLHGSPVSVLRITSGPPACRCYIVAQSIVYPLYCRDIWDGGRNGPRMDVARQLRHSPSPLDVTRAKPLYSRFAFHVVLCALIYHSSTLQKISRIPQILLDCTIPRCIIRAVRESMHHPPSAIGRAGAVYACASLTQMCPHPRPLSGQRR
jgi:hypothetical protein